MAVYFLKDWQREKEENSDDSIFYASPRIVHHLDESFRKKLSNLYRKKIDHNSVILDLMSSWNSHLPEEIKYQKVIGHGLNTIELENNKRLDSFWVQDLNKFQKLPLDDGSIDVCLIVASWQYLQYPENVALEINRVVRNNGMIIVSFTNRAFWNKATRFWIESSDNQRLEYIIEVLRLNGWTYSESIIINQTKRNIFSLLGIQEDPFFSVIATKDTN